MILFAEEEYILMDALLHGQPFGHGTVRAVSDQEQLRRHLLVNPVKDFDHVCKPLYRTEVREMNQQTFSVGSIFFAQFCRAFGIPAVDIAIHRVINHLDTVLDVEHPKSPVAKVVGNGGNPVALLDRVTSDGQVRPVQPDQRNVGAVKRGDERQPAPPRSFGHHLSRQQRAYRMRDGIVNMEKIQIVQLGNFGHAGSERKIVGRIVKKRVSGNLDLVIMNVGLGASQADGLGIGNKMNFMSALGQFQAKFGSHNATATVGGITGDPNLHSPGRPFAGFLFDGRNQPQMQILPRLFEMRTGRDSVLLVGRGTY